MNMPRSALVALLGAGFFVSGVANAGGVTGGSLLSNSDANQLEAWLGVGDQDFTNIWSGTPGVSTATSFHAAADGKGPTFSLFGITLGDDSTATIGGYTTLNWGDSNGSYEADATAFIFNLTTGEVQKHQTNPEFVIYISPSYFPTFGGGHDIFAGYSILGTCDGSVSIDCDGYSYSFSYDQDQGQIAVAGDFGISSGSSGVGYAEWRINSVEIYAFASAAPVPEPETYALMLAGLGLVGVAATRRKRSV